MREPILSNARRIHSTFSPTQAGSSNFSLQAQTIREATPGVDRSRSQGQAVPDYLLA